MKSKREAHLRARDNSKGFTPTVGRKPEAIARKQSIKPVDLKRQAWQIEAIQFKEASKFESNLSSSSSLRIVSEVSKFFEVAKHFLCALELKQQVREIINWLNYQEE